MALKVTHTEDIPDLADLAADVERRYDVRIVAPWQRLTGSEECDVWRLTTTRGQLVLRLSPAWRTLDELRWVHELTRFVAAHVGEVVAPMVALDGTTLFLYTDRPAALFPFVLGERLDREDAQLRESAARLLARLHLAAMQWPNLRERPTSGDHTTREVDDALLRDADLDTWYATDYTLHSLTRGPIHGDYYRGNLLCSKGHIVGVFDWDESRVAPVIEEVAWAAWEFGKTASGDDLDGARARAYLAAYAEAGGPWGSGDSDRVVPLIRWRLRDEIARSCAAEARGEPWDADYREQELRAFERLRGRRI